MSIGLVLRHTYEETCEVCEKIAHFIRVGVKKMNRFFIVASYARAASALAQQGYYEEAKTLMLERKNIK